MKTKPSMDEVRIRFSAVHGKAQMDDMAEREKLRGPQSPVSEEAELIASHLRYIDEEAVSGKMNAEFVRLGEWLSIRIQNHDHRSLERLRHRLEALSEFNRPRDLEKDVLEPIQKRLNAMCNSKARQPKPVTQWLWILSMIRPLVQKKGITERPSRDKIYEAVERGLTAVEGTREKGLPHITRSNLWKLLREKKLGILID